MTAQRPPISPSPVVATIGEMRLPVPVGHSAAQQIPWKSEWWTDRLRDRLDLPVANRLVHTLAKRAVMREDGSRTIPRAAVCEIAVSDDTAAAQFAVAAWGTGTTARERGRHLRHLTDSIASGRHARLGRARDAADEGPEAMWNAHFAVTPAHGFGQVSYGSKWLHFAGWDRVPAGGPQPVVFDRFVWNALTRCGGPDWADLAYPEVATPATQTAWLRWCAAATDAAVDGLTAADVERAVFEHGRSCPRARGDAAHPCTP